MVAGSYRIEYAKSGRAVCTVKTCKDAKNVIPKGSLRLGSWAQIEERGWYAWRHWGCVTPQQLANIAESIEDDWELFDGYDELEGDDKEKVRQAIADGHVADEELTPHMDPQLNRAGAKEAFAQAQKQAVREEKARKKDAEREVKLEQKEAEKQRKLEQKEASKAKKSAKKEARKDAVKLEKQTEKKATKKMKAEEQGVKRETKKQQHTHDDSAIMDSDEAQPSAPRAPKKRKRDSGKAVKLEEGDDDDIDMKIENATEIPHDSGNKASISSIVKNEAHESKMNGSHKENAPAKDRKKVKKETLQTTNGDDQPVLRRSTRKTKS